MASRMVPDVLRDVHAGIAVIHGPQLANRGKTREVEGRKGGRGPSGKWTFEVVLGEVVVRAGEGQGAQGDRISAGARRVKCGKAPRLERARITILRGGVCQTFRFTIRYFDCFTLHTFPIRSPLPRILYDVFASMG